MINELLVSQPKAQQVQIEKKGKTNKSREEIFFQMKGFFC